MDAAEGCGGAGAETEAEWEPGRMRGPLAPGLYLVATPIGNLEDMTLRGLRVLREADRIACEDTRQTQKLLNHYGIKTPTVSYHMHNEAERAVELLAELKAGGRIAVVSDAGTPGLADPGAEVARAAISAGVRVYPVPGANAAVAGVVASGLQMEAGFSFGGFLPAKAGGRRSLLERLREEMRGSGEGAMVRVFYETPHRIVEALEDVEAVFGAEHRVVVARELTKLHEEFLRGTAGAVRAELAGRESVRGEMVLMLSGEIATVTAGLPGVAKAVRQLVAEGVEEKEALKRVAKERGMGKSEAYREWQRGKGR
ncbi:MAG: 16S rRNA (cytidine(1402)-2'-O)-methyltransferase [Acidobacteriaceae bacterium]